MKYLVYSILLPIFIALTINASESTKKPKWVPYKGDSAIPLTIAKNATEKLNEMEKITYESLKVIKVRELTNESEEKIRVTFFAKKCNARLFKKENSDTKIIKSKESEKIEKTEKNRCIRQMFVATYTTGTEGEKLEVKKLNFKKGRNLSERNKRAITPQSRKTKKTVTGKKRKHRNNRSNRNNKNNTNNGNNINNKNDKNDKNDKKVNVKTTTTTMPSVEYIEVNE